MHLGSWKQSHHFPKSKINAPLFAHAAGIATRRNTVRSRHFPLLSVGCGELVGRRDVVFLLVTLVRFFNMKSLSHHLEDLLLDHHLVFKKMKPNIHPNIKYPQAPCFLWSFEIAKKPVEPWNLTHTVWSFGAQIDSLEHSWMYPGPNVPLWEILNCKP